MGREAYQFTGKLASLALAAKARRGEPIGCAPTGYINVHTPDRPRVEVDPQLGPLVRQAFELAVQGDSLRSILGKLTPKGLVSRNDKPMGPSALLNILTNPFYIWLVYHKGQYYQGSHQLLVSVTLFDQVQVRLGQRRRKA